MIRRRIIVAALAAVWLTPFAWSFFWDDEEEEVPPVPQVATTLPSFSYTVTLNGPADEALAERIRGELSLEKRKEKGTPSMTVLQSRLDNDITRTQEVLRAFGYYDGTASGQIGQNNPGSPIPVTITVQQGPQYLIGRFDVVWDGPRPTTQYETIAQDLPATGQNIVNAGDRILAQLKAEGYYDATQVDRRAVLDRPNRRVDITLTLSAGPIVRVGDFQVSGNVDVPSNRIIRLSKLEVGELLTPTTLKDAEDELIASALFDEARVDTIGKNPARTIRFTVDERLPRTVSAALKYSLRDGIAVEAAWEHRNIFGDAEKLRAALTLGEQRQSVELNYREYDFFFDNHTLLASFLIANEDVDGLQYQESALIGTLETEIYDKLILRYGASLEYVRDATLAKEQGEEGANFGLFGLRGELVYDGANDLLDPTEGFRASVRVNPYVGTNGDLRKFTIFEASGSAYFPLDEDRTWVLAGRVRAGSVVGEDRDDIPVAKRFFAGGGGSIRGFSYKRAGPIQIREGEEDRPIGGSSVLEVNGEIRWRINEDFGAVAFVDGGGAFPESFPGSEPDLFIGAGLGVRYYSPIGPIRLDIALPVEGKRENDPSYQLYISIGQAF